MQKVFVAQHHPEAYLVVELLRSNGIESEVRGDTLFATIGGGAVIPGAAPEVWVQNPLDVAQAADLVRRYSKGEALPETSGPTWQCPNCAETLEAQFSECWKCGSTKPAQTSAG